MTTTTLLPDNSGRRAALAGAVGAGLALGLTELVAGLTDRVPSAIASVGSFVVDYSPPFVKDFAVTVFGTADKGALAIGTVVFGLVFGAVVGWIANRRSWVAPLAFALFAALGLAAIFAQPDFGPVLSVVAVVFAAAVGYGVFRLLMRVEGGVADPTAGEQPTDGLVGDGAGATALVAGVAGRSLIIQRSEQVRDSIDLPQAQGTLPPPGPDASFPVEGLESIVVPNDDFYRIDTALIVPRPDANTWSLKITGMVDNELEFSMADLLAMPLYEKYVTIACVSNKVGGGLVGNAKWTGVLLSDLLDRAGVRRGADQVVGRSVDEWTAGFPTELVFDGREPLVALGMNDEMLPPQHGYPARLIVPGLYGYVSATKWLEEIELTTWDAFDGYWVPRGWSKEGPIKTQSRIDVPRDGMSVDPGTLTVAGVAWAPLRGIDMVEVQVGDGEWQQAELSQPLADTAWVQWQLAADLPAGGSHRIRVRATDGTGETQTSEETDPAPNGATGWHTVTVST
jgi:DMSO/TMAO reductase YedYZ molybdopterin-dependent catalytic subunit